MTEREKTVRSPEILFKGDYVNEFVWLYMSLMQLKRKEISMEYFEDLCHTNPNKKEAVFVRKFMERYEGMPIPQMYAEKITKLDALVDEINPLIRKFFISKDDKDRDELMELAEKGIKEIKS